MGSAGGVGALFFGSSSPVKGGAKLVPTPEEYSPLEPISMYFASKLACEALIAGSANTYELGTIVYRLANAVGPRSRQGVIHDSKQKLKEDLRRLRYLAMEFRSLISALVTSLNRSSLALRIQAEGWMPSLLARRIRSLSCQLCR